MNFRKSLSLTLAALLTLAIAKAQVVAPDRKDWTNIGATHAGPPYPGIYYKLFQVNGGTERYSSVFQVMIASDANYYNQQGIFQIVIQKYEASPDRFDGVEIRCISGSPSAATFYVSNNAIWVVATNIWGNIYLRTVGDFASSSPKAPTIATATTPPTGTFEQVKDFGIKYDFDNNTVHKMAYEDFNGNVRIGGRFTTPAGETTPKLAVNGLITATRVKVTQTGWADFVFDPAYALPSLDTVEAFIQKNRHLPEIPSAAEVEKNGQDLGEINKKLLQKIEELTLYIIDLKKENDAQTQAIRDLQEKSKQKK